MKILIYTILFCTYTISLYKFFEKAGEKNWKAIIPIYNIYIWLKIIKKPWWWLFLLIFPGVNIIMIMIMSVNTATIFGKIKTINVILSAFLPFYYLPKLAFDKNTKYVGKIDRKIHKKTKIIEWRDALLFAIIAASIIRTYFLEAYNIPTASMEKTLLKGDFLFVSKFHYGARIPQTPLSFPLAHHTMPILNTKSFLEWIDLPYMRLPALSEVKRNDIVVFNLPVGDTVDFINQSTETYYAMVNNEAFIYLIRDIMQNRNLNSHENYIKLARKNINNSRKIITRPVDKKENYVKRCVAIAGDTLEIKNGNLFINHKPAYESEQMQYSYKVKTSSEFQFSLKRIQNYLKDTYLIDYEDQINSKIDEKTYIFLLTNENQKKLNHENNVVEVTMNLHKQGKLDDRFINSLRNQISREYANKVIAYLDSMHIYDPSLYIFPNKLGYNWTIDNFGPLVIPKKGMTINLNQQNFDFYERVIKNYEHNNFYKKENKFYIDKKEITQYTFKLNYYWMMGDNRHNSQDSRFWGFVPEDHIVGTPILIWFSKDPDYSILQNGIRWNRLFSIP